MSDTTLQILAACKVIRAPRDGVVHQMAVRTIGEVVSPTEPLMFIVPVADELTAEVKVPPQNIDQLSPDQRAILRFSAFDQRTTPQINGTLTRVLASLRGAAPPATLAKQISLNYHPSRTTQ